MVDLDTRCGTVGTSAIVPIFGDNSIRDIVNGNSNIDDIQYTAVASRITPRNGKESRLVKSCRCSSARRS